MANGSYIGKISALVTASTSDLSRKLRGAAQDVDRFGNSVRAQFDRASRNAENSLNQIFTPLQRLQRALTAGRSATLNILKPEDVRRLQQSVSLAEQINKPLASAARAFQNLSADAAGAFAPALVRAQEAAVQLSNTLAETGQVGTTQFNRTKREVEATAQAIQRLNSAQRASDGGFTGNELQFVRPAAFDEINASAAVSRQAAALPLPQREDTRLRDLVRQLAQYRSVIVETAAQVEALELAPDADPAALEAARRRLEQIIETSRRARAEIESVQPPAEANIVATPSSLVEDFDRLQRDRASAARDALGKAIDAPSRSISSLEGRIVSLKGQLATLPEPLRSQFVPSVKSIEDAFVRLRVQGVNATEEDIQRLITAVSEAERAGGRAFSNFGARGDAAQQFRTSFGGAGTAGLNLGIDRRQLQGVGAEIEFVQQKLAGLANDVRGPVVGALQRYRRVVAQTFRNGAQNTEEGRQAIERARQEVIRLAADVLKVRPEKIGQQLKRAGDIARGGFGNISLGIQQAAFAIDDFFSVTGGLDQRIRAAGNNISQLGFVIGSTEGLVLGIAASIGAQLIAALIKWYNAGVDLQDQQRALNDTLARQKSIVEDLANAYQAVADAIARTGFSDRTKELREQSRLIDEVRKKQQEQTREVLGGLSRDVQRERALIASLERRLEGETDPGERVRIQRQINDAREREREATDRVAEGAAAPALGAANAIAQGRLDIELEAIRGAEVAAASGFPSPVPVDFQAQRDAARRRAAESEAGIVEQVRGAGGARAQVARAQQIIDEEIERLANEIDESLGSAGDAQRREQIAELELLRESVGRDIFRNATNEIAADLLEIAVRASEGIGESLELLSGAFSGGASQAAALLETANQRLVDIAGEIEAAQQAGDVDRANALRQEAEALNDLQQELASTARSVASFADALDRVSGQLLNTVVNEARSAENQARREANRAGGTFELGGMPRQEARARAERDAQRARSERQRIEDFGAGVSRRNRELVAEFEQEQLDGRPGGAAARFIRDRDAAQAEINRLERERDEAIKSGDSEAARRASREIEEQEERRRAAQRGLDREFENSEQGQEARRNADFVDGQRQKNASFQQELNRGRELQLSPAERAGRELARDLRALEIAFVDDGGGNRQEFEADRQRIIDEALRSTAPAIFALTDSVLNAVLAGPSRAALQATDVSSVQGSAELNRLLRGEDAGRDQNLVELRRQSKALEELVREVKDNDVDIAN